MQHIPALPPGGEHLVFGATAAASPQPWVAFSDGSVKKARAAAGFVLYDADGTRATHRGWALPAPTRDSNVPELEALAAVVECAAQQGARHLVCLTDSFQGLQALVRAGNGAATRYPAVQALLSLLPSFERIEFRNIDRRHNKEADLLCQAHR